MLTKLKIYRRNWGYRPEDIADSRLRNEETGRKCCLGFVASACGVKASEMSDVSMPSNLSPELKSKFPEFLLQKRGEYLSNSSTAVELAEINDSNIPRKEKEAAITEIFAENGIEVEFTG